MFALPALHDAVRQRAEAAAARAASSGVGHDNYKASISVQDASTNRPRYAIATSHEAGLYIEVKTGNLARAAMNG
ncbi:MAG: hypothetical protein LBK54_10320 [Propionibacteriaceae bacterium]|nr:hypothetical protein [Propionibacteriaceae bacterium]